LLVTALAVKRAGSAQTLSVLTIVNISAKDLAVSEAKTFFASSCMLPNSLKSSSFDLAFTKPAGTSALF
jgi:hypothetical protein